MDNKCVFNCCQNRITNNAPKAGLFFIQLRNVPPSVRGQWIRIVARERREPQYRPKEFSVMCSEHFAPYDISKTRVNSTALPTINIGPYDDTVVIPDDGKTISKYNDDDIVCVIENQISSKPKPQTSQEQDEDIENQIQWSLVGTSKYFEGLLQTDNYDRKLEIDMKLIADKEDNVADEVVILDDDDDVDSSKKSEIGFKDEYCQYLENRSAHRKKFTPSLDDARKKYSEKVKKVTCAKQALTTSVNQQFTPSQKSTKTPTIISKLSNKQQLKSTGEFATLIRNEAPPQRVLTRSITSMPNAIIPQFVFNYIPSNARVPHFILTPRDQPTRPNSVAQLMEISTVGVGGLHTKTYYLTKDITASKQHLNKIIPVMRTGPHDLSACIHPSLENRDQDDDNQFQPVIVKTERVEDF